MARKKQLRATRAGTVINTTSKKQESDVVLALQRVETHLNGKFAARIALTHEKRWLLKDIVTELRRSYPHVRFHHHFDNTSIRPDGGMLCIRGSTENDLLYPILIAEVKNQGTNDLRVREGLPRQARGNAIERLGKNLIGLRTALMRESIFLSSVSGTAVTSRPIRPFWIGYRRWPCSVNSTRPTYTTRTRGGLAGGASTFDRASGRLVKWPQ